MIGKAICAANLFILLVLNTYSLCGAQVFESTNTKSDSTLTKNELIQLRKETILQEIQSHAPGSTARFFHKWQLRLLLLTLSAGYLVLKAKKDASDISLTRLGWLFAILIMIASWLYDAHLDSLSHRVGDRLDYLYEQLYSLPTLEKQELIMEFERVQTVRHGMKCGKWPLRWEKLKSLDSLLFYTVVLALWMIGFFGFKKNRRRPSHLGQYHGHAAPGRRRRY